MLTTLSQAPEQTLPASSLSEQEAALNERARTGDHQTLLEVYHLLQERLLRRAIRYVQHYRQSLPWYLDAQDLAQEASLAMYLRLDEACTKDHPIAYLVGSGYAAIRCAGVRAMCEPPLTSLDRSRAPDDATLLHECVPAPTTPLPSLSQEHPHDAPLYQALAQLPEEQQTVIQHYYGLHEHAPSHSGDIRRELGWTRSRTRYQRKKALATLALALTSLYPHSADQHTMDAHIAPEQRARLDHAYRELRAACGKAGVLALKQASHVDSMVARAYLLEQEGDRRHADHQRLEQVYREMQETGQHITVSELARQAGTYRQMARKFLREREGTQRPTAQERTHWEAFQRLERAYRELPTQGQTITIKALAQRAEVSRPTAEKYLKEQEVRA